MINQFDDTQDVKARFQHVFGLYCVLLVTFGAEPLICYSTYPTLLNSKAFVLVVSWVFHQHQSFNQVELKLPVIQLASNELEEENDENLKTTKVREHHGPSLNLDLRLNQVCGVKKVSPEEHMLNLSVCCLSIRPNGIIVPGIICLAGP